MMSNPLTFKIKIPDKRILHGLEARMKKVQGIPGRYGILEKIALKIGLIQQSLEPFIQNPILLLFAGDHLTGIRISDDPVSPAARRIHKMFLNEAPVLQIAKKMGVGYKIIDAGVYYPLDSFVEYWINRGSVILNKKVRGAARDFLYQPSLTTHEVHQAIFYGADLVNTFYYNGSNAFLFGHVGTSCKISTLALSSALLGKPVDRLIYVIDREDEILLKYAKIALKKHPKTSDVINNIAHFGTAQIAMMAGAMLKLAEKEIFFVVDDNESLLSLLAAWKLHPEVLEYAIVAQNHSAIAKEICSSMHIMPTIDFRISADEGMGSLLVYSLIQSAIEIIS